MRSSLGGTMRWLLFVAAICLLPRLAFADCRDEALAARSRATSAGPMHFETLGWNRRYARRSCGQIHADREQHQRGCGERDVDRIRIGDEVWDKDEFGWVGPYGTVPDGTLPGFAFPFQIVGARCLGELKIDGAELKTYEFVVRQSTADTYETLFVDAATGDPVRYDSRPGWRDDTGSQTTYRPDPAIRIVAPAVDRAERRAVSLRLFSGAVSRSDPACRQELIGIIRRGETAAFEFRIATPLHGNRLALTGVFAPPRSLHYTDHVATSHEGHTDLISIGGQIWSKSEPRGWAPDGGRMLLDRVFDILVPTAEQIGAVACLGPAKVDGRDHAVYEYDFYVDEDGVINRSAMRRVLVDSATRLPVRVEHVGARSEPQSEVRRYDPALTVRPPVVDTPAQPSGR